MERECLVLLPMLAGGEMSYVVRAWSSMHAAAVARAQCTVPMDPNRQVRVVLGGQARHAHANAQKPWYLHTLRQIDDWEMRRAKRCEVTITTPDSYRGPIEAKEICIKIEAASVMEAAGRALLRFTRMKVEQVGTMTIVIRRQTAIQVEPNEFWAWLSIDDIEAPDYPVKAYLRERHGLELTREEKRFRQRR